MVEEPLVRLRIRVSDPYGASASIGREVGRNSTSIANHQPLPAPKPRRPAALVTHSPVARRPARPLSEILAALRLAIFVATLSALAVVAAAGAAWIVFHVLQRVIGPG